jgi:hypothetical protein
LHQLLSRVDLQLLNIVLRRFTQIGNQMEAVGDLNGKGTPWRPPSAYTLDRSRVITSTWMQTKPLSKAIGASHRKQVDHL